MVDKILSVVTKVFAVVLVVITIMLATLVYKNKYMLVQGQETTLENSIYSSKDLEIAIQDIDRQNENIKLTVKNKTDEALSIELNNIILNGNTISTDYIKTVKSNTTSSDVIDIDMSDIDKDDLKVIETKFIVNNIHNLDLTINIRK